ncbi:MAG TPA: WYL domain-containing transcriptional regulator [Chthoniobacterales bacterium]|nr:WYL domain-containing transcriptional regulator [Chthoniobacterales bacterium]
MVKNNENFSRPPLERMMRLHAALKARKFPNCQKIAAELEVSAKTIQRDIDFMRYRLGLPIDYHPQEFGFFYTEPVTAFPNIEVSEGEITALLVAQKALGQYKGTPFERPLQSAFRKLTDGLKDRVSFSWHDLEDAISFRSAGASIADLEMFETVSKGVLRCVELEFEYRKLKSAGYEARRVRPYHLGCLENQWYLFAEDLERRQLRTFALPRMRKVKLTTRGFRRPADFSITEILSGSFGVYSSGKKQRIRIEFDPFAARLVAERKWHESQRVRENKDGSIVLEVELGGLEEIERWILSWGKHARVRAPKELVARIRAEASAILEQYEK